MSTSIADLRRHYTRAGLLEADAGDDPIALFHRWFDEAVRARVPEPNAMTLATASPEGVPSARVVLLKAVEAGDLVFYTNYASDKARELDANPRAAVVFLWLELERQVRVTGPVSRVDRAAAEAYFHSRPVDSQLGAWASRQSQPIADRDELEQRFAALKARYEDSPIPLPEFWGGYRITPETIEFWQGRPSRLHDRLRYERDGESWRRVRLAP